jgi:hypothetical protein
MVAFYWHGWRHWLFGVQWFQRGQAAWIFRWILSLGPFDVRWRCL